MNRPYKDVQRNIKIYKGQNIKEMYPEFMSYPGPLEVTILFRLQDDDLDLN